ncbi:EAL domain-containing protein [bacterium BFN5]|nr:EAL domain-containing protein [bacterium BFN5]
MMKILSFDELKLAITHKKFPLFITLLYCLLGIAWLLISDTLIAQLSLNPENLIDLNTSKGSLYFLITAGLIYCITSRSAAANGSKCKPNRDNGQLHNTYCELDDPIDQLNQQIAALQQQAAALTKNDHEYRSLFEKMMSAFALHQIICNQQGSPVDYRFLDINPAFVRLTGLQRDQVIGKTVCELMPHTEKYWIERYGQVALTGHPASFSAYSQEMQKYYQVEAYSPEYGLFATHFLDITPQVEHTNTVEHMAYHDSLTALPNRVLFQKHLHTAIEAAAEQGSRLAILFLDLDDFKLINNTYGHSAGDQLLTVIAARLKACISPSCTVARMGGDEFTVLLPGAANSDMVTTIAMNLINTIREPWTYGDTTFRMSAKIGIALYPDDGLDAETLMKMADIAMFKARERGKGSYQYYVRDMDSRIAKRLEIESNLYRALEEDQFVLYYQPQVDVLGYIVGVEALIRWQHPTKGMISPAEFIPIAEESGAIIPIDQWVLATACRQNKLWQNLGLPPIYISVNLSARQFQQANLLNVVTDTLRDTQLDPKWLTIEITESIAMKHGDYTIEILKALKAQGIKIALDDFGMGYSSLIYLKRFPINTLKIDRSFIQDINGDSDGAFIAKAIIGLGQNLKLNVVAEGVETMEQLQFLQNQNCTQMQGFIFSRPLPADEMTELLRKYA